MNTELENKVALVTGASRGIGADIAKHLALRGARVAVNYHSSAAKADEVVRAIEESGGAAVSVQADIGSRGEIEVLFDTVEARLGKVDILVNNAGLEVRGASQEVTEADYDRMLDTNLKGAFFCAQRAQGPMKEAGWGRIVNVSSVHEIKATGFSAPYSMSKGGMFMMMRELALELGPHGITVNNIAPGAIRTDMNRDVLSDPDYETRIVERTPVRFIGETADVARVVTFLSSPEARFITGSTLFVDGGLTL